MSIKNKKRLRDSNNAYRWERIEEYLILQGYILVDDRRSLRVWIDCVANGRDIQFNLQSVKWQAGISAEDARLRAALLRSGLPVPEGEFDVMCRQSVRGHGRVYKRERTIRQAVQRSREDAHWDS